jgi:hypothetical protein
MLPVRGYVQLVTGRDSVICDPRRSCVLSPSRDHLFRLQTGSAKVHLHLTGSALHQQLTALLGEPLGEPLELSPQMSLTEECGQKIAGSVGLALADFRQANSLSWSAATVQAPCVTARRDVGQMRNCFVLVSWSDGRMCDLQPDTERPYRIDDEWRAPCMPAAPARRPRF